MLGAVYGSATAAHQRAVASGACVIAGDEATAHETWAFMLDREEACPLAWCILLWAIIQEAIQALQDSAGNRDAATHFAVLPVLAAVCFASHATQYALLIPEALLQRETMSTAERTVIDEFIIFQRTKVSPTPETLNTKPKQKKLHPSPQNLNPNLEILNPRAATTSIKT